MIIAIDGPAGAGKSTIATQVAQQLGFQLIDTGAIYRTVALYVLRNNIALEDAHACANIARGLDFSFSFEDGINTISCNGEQLGQEIRTSEVSQAASKVSAHGPVRDALLDVQRQLGSKHASVLEGRDIGTVVFPDAACKIFLTASAEERAKRRHDQMVEKGDTNAQYNAILSEIIERDTRDSNRTHAPLKQADDARVVDTSGRAIDDIVREIVAYAQA